MSDIDHLSPEIIPMIARYLESRDFFNLRLGSLYLRDSTFALFLKLYFRTRTHMLSRHSLMKLLDISHHPILGPSIRSVVITTNHLTPDGLSDEPYLPTWMERNVYPIDKKRYREYYIQQNSFRQSGLDTTYLSEILANAVHCRTLALADRDQPWGAAFLERETGVYPTSSMENEYSKIYVQQVTHVIIAAATASGVSIEKFELNAGLGRAMNPSVLRFPELHRIQLPWAATLTSLRLLMSPNYDEDPHVWSKPLADFISLFPRLEVLDLYFNRRLQQAGFQALSQALSLPNLRILRLGGFDCLSDDLLLLFGIHQNSLREVVLNHVGISTRLDGSWQKLVTMLHAQLQITKLEIVGCNVDGHLICLRKSDLSLSAQSQVLGETRQLLYV
ncbi:unnamed protein product [Penicillium egyptiacum]|uniref:F-box domain-containing protein n=1 Tax=Penicillium egyptiacum TaxID=1303716 RepID=A0A9W4P430_9EURO|nr:unnamed protein product [Penicillium egyptiacum]